MDIIKLQVKDDLVTCLVQLGSRKINKKIYKNDRLNYYFKHAGKHHFIPDNIIEDFRIKINK